jgi:hypothetical protein
MMIKCQIIGKKIVCSLFKKSVKIGRNTCPRTSADLSHFDEDFWIYGKGFMWDMMHESNAYISKALLAAEVANFRISLC